MIFRIDAEINVKLENLTEIIDKILQGVVILCGKKLSLSFFNCTIIFNFAIGMSPDKKGNYFVLVVLPK